VPSHICHLLTSQIIYSCYPNAAQIQFHLSICFPSRYSQLVAFLQRASISSAICRSCASAISVSRYSTLAPHKLASVSIFCEKCLQLLLGLFELLQGCAIPIQFTPRSLVALKEHSSVHIERRLFHGVTKTSCSIACSAAFFHAASPAFFAHVSIPPMPPRVPFKPPQTVYELVRIGRACLAAPASLGHKTSVITT